MFLRKKLEIVEAIEWDGNNYQDIFMFLGGKDNLLIDKKYDIDFKKGSGGLIIKTKKGREFVPIGYWIIKNQNNEYEVLSKDELFFLYEEIK